MNLARFHAEFQSINEWDYSKMGCHKDAGQLNHWALFRYEKIHKTSDGLADACSI
jgi:hypothetical protein